MNKQKSIKLLEDEAGFAPLIVSMIIIIVLSLMTLGFVTLMSSNQKNALNLQLNNSAYYAAESGINDAIQAIKYGYTANKTTCGPISGNSYFSSNQVGNNEKYTCLLVDQTPPSLVYNLGYGSSKSIIVSSTNQSENINQLTINWSSQGANGLFPNSSDGSVYCNNNSANSNPIFYPAGEWTYQNNPVLGIIRLSITPLSTNQSQPTDTSNTYTVFLYPVQGCNGIAPAYTSSDVGNGSGTVVGGSCSTSSNNSPTMCSTTINMSQASDSNFVVSIASIYKHSSVTLSAVDSNQNIVQFRNAQIVIDSTGEDNGTYKRIQVRVDKSFNAGIPVYGIVSMNSMCKDLQAWPSLTTTVNGTTTTYPGGANGGECGL